MTDTNCLRVQLLSKDHMVGKSILMASFIVALFNGDVSVMKILTFGSAFWSFLWLIDSNRGIRTLPTTILCRFMIGIWAFLFLGFYLAGNTAAGRVYFSLADTVVCAFWLTCIVTSIFWTAASFASLINRHDPTFVRWKMAGGNPFWDTLPTILNGDGPLIRNGGFAEPQYNGFVPPKNWQHQCPKCGVRVQHAVDVCWNKNCRYGADGDSSAYFDRYGGC